MQELSASEVRSFRRAVRAYHRRHGRHGLPWRRTRNPYRILVSEVMLQQTQVSRVIGRYERFIERFPDFAALARGPLRAVLAAWSGLGYNRRAMYLKRTAERVVSDYGGMLPADPGILVTMPGIGAATAGAIAAFAFGAAHPFIETNIRAVFISHFFADRDGVTDDEILPLIERTIDRRDPSAWYSALMDYGAMLKSTLENPSRRSAHHARQQPFEGSDRQARGLIVKVLTERSCGERTLGTMTGLDPARLRKNIEALVEEGLVVKIRRSFSLG